MEYLPESTIVTQRACHQAVFTALVDESARLAAREVLGMGRDDEPHGQLTTETVVRRGGKPLLNQRSAIGELSESPAILAGRRVLATDLRVGYEDPLEPVAHDAVTARRMLSQLNRFG